MTTKVISFLGTAVKQTVYSYQGQTYEGNLFQVALRQFIPFDKMLVFVTKEAREKAYPTLAALQDPRIEPVDIRTGRTSEGLWQIFSAVVDHVDEGDTVVFDITHGLRSIPFLTFLGAAYLRSAKNVALKAVLYGAFDLGTPAPVIDLTEFVSLLDWLTATNQFIMTGNATALAKELARGNNVALQPLANTVEEIATGLHLLRPKEIYAAATKLPTSLASVRQEFPPPFALLADNLIGSYSRFGQAGKADATAQLGYQLQMINWYHQRRQIVHALSLGREWVVSFLCVHFGVDMEDKDNRDEMELLLNGGTIKNSEGEVLRVSKYSDKWATVPAGRKLRSLWGGEVYNLANLRNDVLHSGFRKRTKSSVEVQQAVDKVLQELNNIAGELGFEFTSQTSNSEVPQ